MIALMVLQLSDRNTVDYVIGVGTAAIATGKRRLICRSLYMGLYTYSHRIKDTEKLKRSGAGSVQLIMSRPIRHHYITQ